MKHLSLLVAAYNKKTRLSTELGEKYNYKRLPLHLHYIILLFSRKINFTHHVKKKSQSKPNIRLARYFGKTVSY